MYAYANVTSVCGPSSILSRFCIYRVDRHLNFASVLHTRAPAKNTATNSSHVVRQRRKSFQTHPSIERRNGEVVGR